MSVERYDVNSQAENETLSMNLLDQVPGISAAGARIYSIGLGFSCLIAPVAANGTSVA
jgi:hypothetical protein